MIEENLKYKFMYAAKWSTITEVTIKSISPVTNMILARIILPEAFGVVATVTMIMSFADMLTEAGFHKYLVQHEFKREEEKYQSANVAFWTNFIMSIFLWLIIIIFRNQIAVLVGNPGLGNVVAAACVQLLITSFSNIQAALYKRDFDFKTLFLSKVAAVCIPFVVTIPLAVLGLSYWALIIGNIFIQVSNAVILNIKSKWKPQLFFKMKILKDMFSFSSWSLIEDISVWCSVWADVFIIGSYFNPHYLGLYKTSTTMVNALMMLITESIVPVFFSALSRLQDDDEKFNKMYFTTQRLVSMFVFPLGIGVYLYCGLATRIILGSKWMEAGSIIGVWALTSSIKIVLGDLCSEVYRAKGRPKVSLMAQLLHLVVLLPVCIISSRYGFWPLVYARSWVRMEAVLVNFILMKAAIGFPIGKIFKNVMPTAIAAAAMGVLGYLLQQMSRGILWSFASIIICIIFYFGVLYFEGNCDLENY